MFDLTAEGERIELLAEYPQVAGRLRSALEAHNDTKAKPRGPRATDNAHNVDRDLSETDQPGDAFANSSN